MEFQDKSNKWVNKQLTFAKENPSRVYNIMLAFSAILVIIIAGAVLAIDFSKISTWDWWWVKILEMVAMSMLFLSWMGETDIKQKQRLSWIELVRYTKLLISKITKNLHLNTIQGLQKEVDRYNKQKVEWAWRSELSKVVKVRSGTKIWPLFDSNLKDEWDNFEGKYTDEIWNEYFTLQKYSKKEIKKSIKIINKIRRNEIKIKGLVSRDSLLYDVAVERSKSELSPDYNETRDTTIGVVRRITTLFGMALIFGCIFFNQVPDAANVILQIVLRTITICSTLWMAYNWSLIKSIKRNNALQKKRDMLTSGMNYAGLHVVKKMKTVVEIQDNGSRIEKQVEDLEDLQIGFNEELLNSFKEDILNKEKDKKDKETYDKIYNEIQKACSKFREDKPNNELEILIRKDIYDLLAKQNNLDSKKLFGINISINDQIQEWVLNDKTEMLSRDKTIKEVKQYVQEEIKLTKEVTQGLENLFNITKKESI